MGSTTVAPLRFTPVTPIASWIRIREYHSAMPQGLIRNQRAGDFHFVTFSCYQRKPYLNTPAAKDLFERSLETMR